MRLGRASSWGPEAEHIASWRFASDTSILYRWVLFRQLIGLGFSVILVGKPSKGRKKSRNQRRVCMNEERSLTTVKAMV